MKQEYDGLMLQVSDLNKLPVTIMLSTNGSYIWVQVGATTVCHITTDGTTRIDDLRASPKLSAEPKELVHGTEEARARMYPEG